jgi:hypothetical protein
MKPTARLTVALAAGLLVVFLLPVRAAAQGAAAQRPAAQASAASKTALYLSHTGQDAVGLALVEGLKDAVRRASSTSLASSADAAEVVLMVSTLNPDAAKPGTVTTASWTLVVMKEATKAYLAGGLRMCDPGSIQKTAADLVTHIEGVLKSRAADIPASAEYDKVEAGWDEAVEAAAAKLPLDTCGVRVRDAFLEQMQVYFKWARAASLTPDVQQAVTAGLSYFNADDSLAKRIQLQNEKLNQCQAELAAVKKTIKK